MIWGQQAFGLPFHDNWWQTETGGILIANYRTMDIKPGSMGRPLPGIDAAIVRHATDGTVRPVEDDLIKSSGHLIGPFEVENVLMTHPAVAEAGVIGKPDPTAMEIVKAFVSLKPGRIPDETLRRDILAHARRRLGAVVAPKELEFRATLPKTRSGKIMRRLLKAQEMGISPGDLSTLDSVDFLGFVLDLEKRLGTKIPEVDYPKLSS